HVATATSHFILAIMALIGCLTHLLQGTYTGVIPLTLTIGGGAVIGAQVGAWLSHQVSGVAIVRALGLALGVVGLRLLLLSISEGAEQVVFVLRQAQHERQISNDCHACSVRPELAEG